MDEKIVSVLVENGRNQKYAHAPFPIRGDIQGPCTACPQLDSNQAELFQEVKQLLANISKKNSESSSSLDTLRSHFSQDNSDRSYFEILNLHNSSKEGGCETLLHLASDASEYEAIEILLKAGADPNATNRWNQLPLHTVVDEGDGCYCPSCNQKNSKCVELLLRHGSKTDIRDWEEDTPLSCSALTLMDDCASVLWDYGSSVHTQSKRHGRTGELVASYIPDTVCGWMDKAIQQHDKERLQLQLDFGVLIGSVEGDGAKYNKETHFLVYMSNVHRKAKEMLLLHPLVQAYVSLKWDVISILFMFLGLAYLGIALLYTCFIISFFLYHCPYEEALEEDLDNGTLSKRVTASQKAKMAMGPWDVSDGSDDPCHVTPWIYTMSGFLICFLSCMVLNEIYEMAQGLLRYFKNGLNYGWLLMIVTLTLNVLPVFVNFHGHWQYIVASFGVFLTWGMFLTQIARHPKIGIYVEMLGSIVVEFLVFSVTYFSLVIGFAMAFAVLFPNNPMFEYVYGFLPFVKALLIMTGELDYETLFDDAENPRTDDLEYSIGAHIIFVGFIIVVTILLSNLLIGLAISDVQELRSRANLSRTERLIQQIDLLETLFHKEWLPSSLKNWYKSRFSIKSVCDLTSHTSHEDAEYEEEEGEIINNNDEDEVNDSDNNKDSDKQSPAGDYKRIIGPIYKGFQPLKKAEKALPADLKEQFIRFINKDECSSKNKVIEEIDTGKSKFCKKCTLLLQSMSRI